ncbi:MAG: hypothetical protein EOP08_08585, partial [Proteobacteria bacterium]
GCSTSEGGGTGSTGALGAAAALAFVLGRRKTRRAS